ncbi:MAG TPA: PorV/PorQ family protein, partial [candidate division Zixibacteria bacterium]|nr:PorV/PorQ family protein [candidate division Zixibacteria bacterium]
WVGTDEGLYRYDTKEKEWRKFTEQSGLPSSKITSLSSPDNQSLWVATPVGLALYERGSWQIFGEEQGIKDTGLYLVYADARNRVWAVSEDNFYRFNGAEWTDYFVYEASVNDTIQKIMRDFIGYSDQNSLINAIYQTKMMNGLESDIPDPGQELKIPFAYSLTHKINVMTYDSEGRLWVGTDYGVKIFYDGKFTLFGYKPYTAEKEMTVEEIAADFLDTDNEVQIDQLARKIRDFNGISTNKIPAGQTVYISSNPLASKITSLMDDGSKVYIGTEKGLVQYSDERFGYFYQEGLEKQRTIDIISRDGETWYATPNKVVVFASAKSEITGMHANWLPELADDIYYEFLSYINHLGEEWGTVGINVTFLSYGELVRVNEYNEIMGTFNSFDMAIGLSYGKKMSNSLSAGLTAKWIYSRLSDQGAGAEIGEGTGSSLGIDIGLLYRPAKRLTFGAAVTNLGPDIAYIDAAQSDPLPRNLAFGLSYKLIDNPYNRLMLVAEINKMLTGLDDGFSEELKEAIENVGFEYWYGSFIAFRAGYIYDQVGQVKTATLGVGIQYRGFRFDFAYIPSSDTVPLANTVRFSLTGRI